MTNAVWPTSLPQRPLAQGYSERAAATVIRTAMEAGPPKVRRRYTAGIRRFELQLRLTPSEADTLDAFYDDTMMGGSLPFDWQHPRTGAAVAYRFVEPPAYTPAAGGQLWTASLRLEVLP